MAAQTKILGPERLGQFVIRKATPLGTAKQAFWVYFKEMTRNNIHYVSARKHAEPFDSKEKAEATLKEIREEFGQHDKEGVIYEVAAI